MFYEKSVRSLGSNFICFESFLQLKCPGVYTLCEANLEDTTDSTNFTVRNYTPLTGNDCL